MKDSKYLLLYILLLLLVIADRTNTLIHFSFKYTDCDQAVMWLGAKEMIQGKFHEPCFYGQSYNPMIESLFAVPLISLGISYSYALPVVTSIMSLVPFILLSFFFLKKQPVYACLILSFLLMMPAEYGMIASLSRGFVTGIFFASFVCLSVYTTNTPIKWMIYSLLSGLAIISNPNSLIILFPVYVYLILNNYRSLSFYAFSVFGAIPSAILYYFIKRFYFLHAGYNLHSMYDVRFYWQIFNKAFKYPNIFFKYVVPFSEAMEGCVLLFILVLLIVVLFRQKRKSSAVALSSVFLVILFSFGFNKVHDGGVSVFFPVSRMFLGLPLLMVLFIPKIKNVESKFFKILITASIFFFAYKIFNVNKAVENATDPDTDHFINISTTENLSGNCQELKKLTDQYKIDLIIFLGKGNIDCINYGCGCMEKDFPSTLRPDYERRTWRLVEEKNAVRKNILFFGNHWNEQVSALNVISNKYNVHLLENNDIPTIALLEKMKISVRKF